MKRRNFRVSQFIRGLRNIVRDFGKLIHELTIFARLVWELLHIFRS